MNKKVNNLNGLLEMVLSKSTVSRIEKMASWFHQTSDCVVKISKLDAFERKLFWSLLREKDSEDALCSAKGLKQVVVAVITGNYTFVTDSGLQCVLKPLSLDEPLKTSITENIRSSREYAVVTNLNNLFKRGLVASFKAQKTIFGLTVETAILLPEVVIEPLNTDTIICLRHMLAIIEDLKSGKLPVSHGLVQFFFINSSVYAFHEPQSGIVTTAIHNGETPEVTVLLQKNKQEHHIRSRSD